MARQKELRERVLSMRLEAILDPRTQISTTVGGYNDDLGMLPWGLRRRHMLSDFQDEIVRRRMMGALACCPRGIVDMLQNPGSHFICQRIDEIAGLARIPADLRTQRFLDQHVRAATDKAVLAANAKYMDEEFSKKTQEQRKRLDRLRIALGTQATERPPQTFSVLPGTRVVRER